MATALQLGVYEKIGVKKIINGWGTITRIGGTLMPPEVIEAMNEAARSFIDMDDLYLRAGEIVAKHTGAEAGLVTTGCAASLLLGTAAAVTGLDRAKQHRLPDTRGMRNEMVIHTAHRNGYDHSFRAAGIEFVEIGYANGTEPWELESAIGPNTAGVAYVIAPSLSTGFLSLETTCRIAHAKGVPVVVDASAMLPPAENLQAFIKQGADLVAFSGGKGIRGPQASGILAGRADLIEAARMQMSPNHAIGRTCKVGKEEVIGLVTALELYAKNDHEADKARWMRDARHIVDEVGKVPGIQGRVELNQRRPTPTAVIGFAPDGPPRDGIAIGAALRTGDPPIYIGSNAAELTVSTHCLERGDAEVIARRLRQVLGG